jgi:hypothetical protein
MPDLDRPRCVRIISDTIEALDLTLEDHTDVAKYDNMDEMLKGHAELQADRKAMADLKEFLERDCE